MYLSNELRAQGSARLENMKMLTVTPIFNSFESMIIFAPCQFSFSQIFEHCVEFPERKVSSIVLFHVLLIHLFILLLSCPVTIKINYNPIVSFRKDKQVNRIGHNKK